MSKVVSDMAALDAALVETRGSADLPEGAAAEEFASTLESEQPAVVEDQAEPEIDDTPSGEGLPEEEVTEGQEGTVPGREKKPAEAAKVAAKTAAKPAEEKELTPEEKAQQEAETEENERLERELDPNTDANVKGLFKMMDKDPAFKAAVDKSPALKSNLFHLGRMAEKAGKYDQMFHSPAMANTAKFASDEFFKMDDLYNGEKPQDFVSFLIANSLEYDEKGNPLVDEKTGRFKSTGAYERLTNFWQEEWRKDIMSYAEKISKIDHEQAKIDGEELMEAMKVIDRVIFGMLKKQRGTGEDDPELAKLPANLREEILASRRSKGSNASTQAAKLADFTTAVDTDVNTMLSEYVDKLIEQVLSRNQKIVLSPLNRKHIKAEAIENIREAEKNNAAHTSTFRHMLKGMAQTDEGRQQLVNVKKAFYREILPSFIRRAFSDVTTSTLKEAQKRQETIQKGVNRREPQTTGRGFSGDTPAAQGDVEAALKEASDKKGRPLTDYERTDVILATHYGKRR